MSDQLSESEQLELHWRMTQLSPEGMKALLIEFMEHGRIPTPADDGPSGEFARLIGDDEHLMQTRVASGLWRWMLITLRERQAAGGKQNG
jgi:hypothetical protein